MLSPPVPRNAIDQPRHVLIGFADAISAPEVVWSLADAGFVVIAFFRKGRKSALAVSKYVQLVEIHPPEQDLAQSLCDLRKQLDRLSLFAEQQVLVMPLDDKALYLLDALKLPAEVVVGAIGPQAEFALDKSRQILAAKNAGFNVPETKNVESVADALDYHGTFPVVFKPSQAVAVRGNRLGKGESWICNDRPELIEAIGVWNRQDPMLIQSLVLGDGVGVFGLATFTGVDAWSSHIRVRMMNPHGSGSSACKSIELPVGIQSISESLIRKSGWKGIFMIELLRDTTGRLWFIEFNGRCWGSMALARHLGLEYPSWNIKLWEDPSFRPPAGPRTSARPLTCRNLGRELLHVAFVLKGRKFAGGAKWPGVWETLKAVCWIRPNDCWYNLRRNDFRVFVYEALYTLCDAVALAIKRRK